MKNKNGFTLIETIISIFIVTLIFTAVTSLGSMKNNIEKQIEYDSDIYEIQNLLIYSKALCKKENSTGHILINSKADEIYFYNTSGGSAPIKKIKLSCNSDCLGESTNLYLSNKGKITSGNTINIKNDEQLQKITIGVGIDTIRIKD